MDDTRWLAGFAKREDFESARACLGALGTAFEVVSPEPGYGRVGVPALVVGAEGRAGLAEAMGIAGWLEHLAPAGEAPAMPPPVFEEDLFQGCSIVLLAPCVADPLKLRLIAQVSTDMGAAFPYLNAGMPQACYNHETRSLSFMDGHRMVSLHPRRVAVAKADEIMDGWRVLEGVRRMVNGAWARRGEIEPSFRMRRKPPALEIYRRLPGTNCRACGEKTCMAFACRLWRGEGHPSQCEPVFRGEHANMRGALTEICLGLGFAEEAPAKAVG